jgi:hypothetical protein
LVFFEQESGTTKGSDIRERKVAEFFKELRKPSKGEGRRENKVSSDYQEREEPHGTNPFLVSRRTELPPRWDGPYGTVVLVDKPKGEIVSSDFHFVIVLSSFFFFPPLSSEDLFSFYCKLYSTYFCIQPDMTWSYLNCASLAHAAEIIFSGI